MADEHKTVLLSIFATLLSAGIVFLATLLISGGISIYYIKSYVLPLVLSAFTLGVFAGVLFAKEKGALPYFSPPESQKPKSEGH